MIDGTQYRPANGTEGDIFMGNWCAGCLFNRMDDEACDIQLRALAHSADQPEYPAEWKYRQGFPVCTAFTHKQCDEGGPSPRCDRTIDMFGEVA